MKITHKQYSFFAIIILFLLGSCKKDFLDAKPNSDIVVPSTLADLQGLLENSDILNKATPALPLMASDDYVFPTYANWQASQTATERNSYIWAKEIYGGSNNVYDWSFGYSGIFYCNNILAALPDIPVTNLNGKQYSTIKGWALFMRAYLLYDLVQNFSPAYDVATSSSDLGMPIRLKPGIDEIVSRSSVQETYAQILKDLGQASNLLDVSLPVSSNQPSKPAAYALFSRIYLSMRDYTKAELYADSTLALDSKLIDYNTVNKTTTTPFTINNDETILSTTCVNNLYTIIYSSGLSTQTSINPDLLTLYDPSDLRLVLYFQKSTKTGYFFTKRRYGGPALQPFTGLATDEIYLIKAECLARRNDVASALNWLNALLKKRFPPSSFVNITAADKNDALTKVLLERRKELVWRTLRWSDLKRLNKEGANITLTRVLNGTTYSLPPNDPRYVFPIPDDEITFSGMQQNIR